MSLRMPIVLALLGLGLPAWSAAQGLGETAGRERTRREQAGSKAEPKRVFTNDDLVEGRPPGEQASPEGSGAATPASGGAATPESGSESGREEAESEEDTRLPSQKIRAELDAVTAARTRVAGLEAQMRQLRDKLNPMSSSFIYGPQGSNNANEEAEVRQQLSQAEAELAGARQELGAATEALEQASRRQGVPLPEPFEPR